MVNGNSKDDPVIGNIGITNKNSGHYNTNHSGYSHGYMMGYNDHTGWWYTYPSEKYESQLG